MDLHQLRIFVTVAEEQHLTRGSQRLYMTPPSVSAQIKSLEDELGVSLFNRTPKGMTLTEQGRQLKLKAEETLKAAQGLINHATVMQSQLMGQLRVGLNASPAFLRISELVHALHDQSPEIVLEFVSESSGSIIDQLQHDRIDIGFLFGASPTEVITTQYLCTSEVVIAGPSHWRDRLQTMDWAALSQLPWIGSDYYCPFETMTRELFVQRGLSYHHTVQSHDEATKSELVGAGVGMAMLELTEAEQARQQGSVIIWETEPMYCELHIGWATNRNDDPLISALRNVLSDIW